MRHESDQEVDDNNINNFSRRILVWSKSTIFGLKMVHPHNSGSDLRIIFKFCTVNRAVVGARYMKISLVFFDIHLGQFDPFMPIVIV